MMCDDVAKQCTQQGPQGALWGGVAWASVLLAAQYRLCSRPRGISKASRKARLAHAWPLHAPDRSNWWLDADVSV